MRFYEKVLKSLGRKRSAYKIFDGPMGEVVLGDLMQFAKYSDEPFYPGMADQTAFNLGAHSVVRHIMKRCHHTPADIEAIARRYAAEEAEIDMRNPANTEEMYAA